MGRIFTRALLVLLGIVALYAGGALLGSAIPANAGWRPAPAGVRVYVIDNGIHTDVVLPAASFGDLVRPEHFAGGAATARTHLAFGWGNRDFYINTPTWNDLSPVRVAAAAVGVGPSVVHVETLDAPKPGPDVRQLVLSPAEFARLEAYVRASFAGGAPVHGYGATDAFYPAHGGYSAFNTCNQWTGRALRSAGVRMGLWTPFPWGVMQWL